MRVPNVHDLTCNKDAQNCSKHDCNLSAILKDLNWNFFLLSEQEHTANHLVTPTPTPAPTPTLLALPCLALSNVIESYCS